MELAGVLFDMDGLLVDTEPLWLRAEHVTMARLGGTWTQADQAAILGTSMAHAAQYLRERAGSDLPAADVAAILLDAMLGQLRDGEIPLQPGAAALLREVGGSGVPFALVSNSVRPIVDLVLDALVRAGAPPFPVTVAGDEVRRGKPDPMPYLTAARALGVDVTATVVLEDSPSGVRAAEAAGATVVAVPHAVPVEATGRVHVRDSLVGLDLAGLRALLR